MEWHSNPGLKSTSQSLCYECKCNLNQRGETTPNTWVYGLKHTDVNVSESSGSCRTKSAPDWLLWCLLMRLICFIQSNPPTVTEMGKILLDGNEMMHSHRCGSDIKMWMWLQLCSCWAKVSRERLYSIWTKRWETNLLQRLLKEIIFDVCVNRFGWLLNHNFLIIKSYPLHKTTTGWGNL